MTSEQIQKVFDTDDIDGYNEIVKSYAQYHSIPMEQASKALLRGLLKHGHLHRLDDDGNYRPLYKSLLTLDPKTHSIFQNEQFLVDSIRHYHPNSIMDLVLQYNGVHKQPTLLPMLRKYIDGRHLNFGGIKYQNSIVNEYKSVRYAKELWERYKRKNNDVKL